ncbi:MAG: hypothetical protein EZS28_010041 [Streblomastix strix]|uniref:Dynein heavy chain AAA lid domain-containing protein n=1 Tax=Streblomastix strix TaxID=222440 RepID=A0A5J4WJ92_9EUKA|nr:MAG: hypothetical protein EZS28_010041 [Streblomastix strix]
MISSNAANAQEDCINSPKPKEIPDVFIQYLGIVPVSMLRQFALETGFAERLILKSSRRSQQLVIKRLIERGKEEAFPVAVLQTLSKVVIEPPLGLRVNLQRSMMSFTEHFDDHPDPLQRVRRKYGPLGWNIMYDWTLADLDVSRELLLEYLGGKHEGDEDEQIDQDTIEKQENELDQDEDELDGEEEEEKEL